MIKQLVDGLNDVTNSEYHSNKSYISSSGLKVALKSIAAFKHEIVDGNRAAMSNENALSEGSLCHAEILEAHNVHHDFVFYEGLRKAGKEFDDFKASLNPADARKTIISKPQKLRVQSYLRAFKRRPEAVQLITNGFAEQTICGTLHGIQVKARFDYINVEKGEIYDVKTTAKSADLEQFKQTIKEYSYQLSAALYLAMAEQFYGKKFTFLFIVISKQDPQDCQVYKLSDASRAEGADMVRNACDKIRVARENNIWVEPTLNLRIDNAAQKIEVSEYEILEV